MRKQLALLACAVSLLPFAAHAQHEPDDRRNNDDQEIIVTAQKTGAQTLQAVPLAIQAFSGETLKERNINDINDLMAAIPGAAISQQQSVASRSYSIRGAGSAAANGDSPIGYYVDDVPFVVTNFGIAPPIRFLDLERVEVLRGPQGTLYGQGSAGGVFIFHTRDPDLETIKYAAEAETSRTREADAWNYGFAAAVSVPIIKDVLAVRISGGHSFNPGWADEYYGPYGSNGGVPDRKNVNSVKNDDIRVVALLKPADNVSVRAQYWHFRPRQQFLGALQNIDPPAFADTAGQPSFGNGDFKLYSLTAKADFDAFSITSATTRMTGQFGIYVPISPAGFFSSQFFPKMFSQELRVNSASGGPLHWLLGGAYQNGQGPQANALEIGSPPFLSINADNNTRTKNWATFGEISYDLFDGKLVPLAGLRYYHDKRTFEDATSVIPTKSNVVTWRANLSYLPSDSLTMFATAATGFRPGVVQSRVQATLLQEVGVLVGTQTKPERSTNYEIGIKWRSPDRKLSLGLNGYITKYRDIISVAHTLNPQVDGFANFGDATAKGVDIEFQWRTPLDGFVVGATANFNDSKYTRVDPAVQASSPYLVDGSRLINTVAKNWRLDASYNANLGGDWTGFVNAAWNHTGNRLQANYFLNKPYENFTGSIGVRKGQVEVMLFAENLSDERGPTISFGTPDNGIGITPRTIGLRLRLNGQ